MNRVDYSSKKIPSANSVMSANKFDDFFNNLALDLIEAGDEYGFNGTTSISSSHNSGDQLTDNEWQGLILNVENALSEVFHDDIGENLDNSFIQLMTSLRALDAGDEIKWTDWNQLVESIQSKMNQIIDYFEN